MSLKRREELALWFRNQFEPRRIGSISIYSTSSQASSKLEGREEDQYNNPEDTDFQDSAFFLLLIFISTFNISFVQTDTKLFQASDETSNGTQVDNSIVL